MNDKAYGHDQSHVNGKNSTCWKNTSVEVALLIGTYNWRKGEDGVLAVLHRWRYSTECRNEWKYNRCKESCTHSCLSIKGTQYIQIIGTLTLPYICVSACIFNVLVHVHVWIKTVKLTCSQCAQMDPFGILLTSQCMYRKC